MEPSQSQQPSKQAVPQSKPRALKAPRVTRACDACRKRKVRCDGVGMNGEKCALCQSSGADCTFVQTATRRGPPKGYVESLERRLEAMESLLQSLSAANGSEAPVSQTTADSSLDCPSISPVAGRSSSGTFGGGASTGAPSSPESPIPALSPPAVASLDAIDRLTSELDELSVENDRYVGRGSGLHLVRSLHEFSSGMEPFPMQDNEPGPSLVEQMLHNEHRKAANAFALPPEDLGRRLANAFFEHVNESLAVLHRPYFERCITSGLLESDSSFRSLYFMVLALGARWVTDDPRLVPPTSPSHPNGANQSRGYEFFRASSGTASPTLMSATLFDIQCSTLGVIWLMGSASPISAWAAIGFALRRVVDVGAHRENRARWNNSPLEDQLRRRAFHLLFGLDRMISSSLGRPIAMQEEDFDLKEAIDITDEALDEWEINGKASPPATPTGPTPVSGHKCMVALTKITGTILRLLYGMKSEKQTPQQLAESVSYLDSLLNAWLATVPEHLRWNPLEQDPKFLPQTVALYAHYYSNQILVHREFLSPNRPRVHGFPSLAICSNAARSCANVLDVLRQKGQLEDAFFYAPFSAITAGLILLINVFSGGSTVTNLTSSAMNDVKRCINVLSVLGDTTFVARKCHTGLCRLTAFATSSRSNPAQIPNHAHASLKRSNPDDWLDGQSPDSSMHSPEGGAGSTETDEDGHRVGPNGYKIARNKLERTSTLPASTSDLSLATFNGRPTFAFGDATMSLEQLQQQQQQAMAGFTSSTSTSTSMAAGSSTVPSMSDFRSTFLGDTNLWTANNLATLPPSAPSAPAFSQSSAAAPINDIPVSFSAAPSSTSQFVSPTSAVPTSVPSWTPTSTAGLPSTGVETGFAPAPIDTALFNSGGGADAGGWQSMLAGIPLASPPTGAPQQQQSFGSFGGAGGFDFSFGAGASHTGMTPGGHGMDLWDPSLFGDYDFSNISAFGTSAAFTTPTGQPSYSAPPS